MLNSAVTIISLTCIRLPESNLGVKLILESCKCF